jgi:hypothetical protein
MHKKHKDAFISQCSMTRASPEATGRRHRVNYSVRNRPGGCQGDSKQNKGANFVHFADHFDGHRGAPVLYHAHRPMEEVRGFHKSH